MGQPFLKIGLTFATLQAFGNWQVGKFTYRLCYNRNSIFQKISITIVCASSFRNLYICIILETSSLELLLGGVGGGGGGGGWGGSFFNDKFRIVWKTDFRFYLLGALGSLIKRDSAIFEKKSSKVFAIIFLSNVWNMYCMKCI